jgi:hypothetical protein
MLVKILPGIRRHLVHHHGLLRNLLGHPLVGHHVLENSFLLKYEKNAFLQNSLFVNTRGDRRKVWLSAYAGAELLLY